MNVPNPDIFQQLVAAVRRVGDPSTNTINGIYFKNTEISELMLVETGTNQTDLSVQGISFEVFGMDFVMVDDGTITTRDEDNYMTVSDRNMYQAIINFLMWRIKVIDRLGI